MGMSHCNDTTIAIPRSPDQRNATTVQKAPNTVASFAIVFAVIFNLIMLVGKYQSSVRKV